MVIQVELDKEAEQFVQKEIDKKNITLSEYFNFLVKKENKKQNIKNELIEVMQELSFAKQGKIKLNSINNLFNV